MVTNMALTLADITRVCNDEAAAYQLLESIRWPNGPVCPHCGTVDDAHYMEPKGEGRKSTRGNVSQRRPWRCDGCRKQFSVLVDTIFHDSHIPLGKWLMEFHLICSVKNGISAHELSRQLAITVKSAWFMDHRIRYAMARPPLSDLLTGTGEFDWRYNARESRDTERTEVTLQRIVGQRLMYKDPAGGVRSPAEPHDEQDGWRPLRGRHQSEKIRKNKNRRLANSRELTGVISRRFINVSGERRPECVNDALRALYRHPVILVTLVSRHNGLSHP